MFEPSQHEVLSETGLSKSFGEPKRLPELMSGPDRAKVKRVMEAMMQMIKLDVAKLEAAAEG